MWRSQRGKIDVGPNLFGLHGQVGSIRRINSPLQGATIYVLKQHQIIPVHGNGITAVTQLLLNLLTV